MMALRLNESNLITEILESIPTKDSEYLSWFLCIEKQDSFMYLYSMFYYS